MYIIIKIIYKYIIYVLNRVVEINRIFNNILYFTLTVIVIN